MNDRVSAAPPPGFLGDDIHDDAGGRGSAALAEWERQFYAPGDGPYAAEKEAQGSSRVLRRPKSSLGWLGGRHHQSGGGGKKAGGFSLAPLWDGVREKLNLRGSRSSGSIGRVVGSMVGVARGEKDGGVEKQSAHPPPPSGSYPSREEVMESYKNLVASGFFEAHAIRGGRHPLRTTVPPTGRPSVDGAAVPPPTGKSFADHMAAQKQQPQQPQRRRLQLPLVSAPIKPRIGIPPAPPPRSSSHGKIDSFFSTPRGIKRGASIDLAAEAEAATRKLVKKLRHSASRLSTELTGARGGHHQQRQHHPGYAASAYAPSPLSPASSTFSCHTAPPSVMVSLTDDPLPPARYGKLSKLKEGHRRRLLHRHHHILGLARKKRRDRLDLASSSTSQSLPLADVHDVAMVDAPAEPPAPPSRRNSSPPQPTQQHTRLRLRASSAGARLITIISGGGAQQQKHEEHEPLSVMPDPNRGIPAVPRIPTEYCDSATSAETGVTAALPATATAYGGDGGGRQESVQGREAEAKPRDSALGAGDNVENIPVWA